MPRVIPKAEEANTVPRSLYTQTVKLERQAMATSMAHYQRGHTIEEELQKGVSPNVIGGMVAVTTFNAPHQNPLAVFMWKRPMNSAILVAATHRRLGRAYDGTNT